jgi:hypothetical protein
VGSAAAGISVDLVSEGSITMKREQFVAAIVVATVVFALVGSGAAFATGGPPRAPSARQWDMSGVTTPGTPLPILANPASPMQAALVGSAGTLQGHIVWTPLAVAPPAVSDGYQEDSRFTVEGFVGSAVVQGPLAAALFGENPHVLVLAAHPTDISLQVHFGTQPSKPLLTLRSDPPLLYFPHAGQPGMPVRFLQIVGLQVIASN